MTLQGNETNIPIQNEDKVNLFVQIKMLLFKRA